ncbi:MAG: 50S ribosomal protein L29 [Patescibacteria group bacterium]|nr:50S ribosomal protein L29 [Patescibacteria group bacterium]
MEIAEARKLKPAELVKEIEKTKQQVVKLRSEVAMRRIKNFNSLKNARAYLARLLTISNEQKIIKSIDNNE